MKKLLLSISCLLIATCCFSQSLQVVNLTCEGKTAPLGIGQTNPKLAWQLQADGRGVLQTAYRILVADNPEALQKGIGNVWDSKKIASDASIQINYAGKALKPASTYYWKMMVWDNKQQVSPWSREEMWQTGLIATADWKGARWIAYDQLPDSSIDVLPLGSKGDRYVGNNVLPLLRKNFTIIKQVKKATMFISGLGQFDLSMNGKKIGDHFLDPGWTKYDKQALYVPFDVTGEIRQGVNAIGVMLGNGFYYIPPVKGRYRKMRVAFGYPKMICRLVIEYTDGSWQDVVSDASWKTAKSPIIFSSIYGGEDYDANLEQTGWDAPGFNDNAWKPVLLVSGPPALNAQMPEPLKVMETFAPRGVTQPQPGVWVYDLGQNASGIPSITLQGKKGDTVRITPAELLKDDGTANQKASGSPYYFDYILKGLAVETWQPRFTYYGFRYLQISGAAPQGQSNVQNLPVITKLTGLHIRNAAAGVSSFTSSNPLFNKTHALINWAIKSNMMSLFTDCPHREKLGWLEEAHLMGNSVRFNYDIANLCQKVLTDISYSQTDSGLVPGIAPEYVQFDWGGDMFRDSPEWGSAGIILPWYMYEWYGDKQVLAAHYTTMQRYMDYLKGKAKNGILSQGLGDWYDIGPKPPGVSQLTPMGVTGTAVYYYDLTIMSKIAGLLGKAADASRYATTAAAVKQAFNKTFFHPETAQYATGSQTANAMAVYMKLVEPQYKDAVVENIVKDIRSRGNSLTAGDIGYRYLIRVLDDEGRSDVIFDMNSRSDVPGYGYQLAKGATALTESWQAFPTASNNHFMLGHLMEWLYTGLAGINQSSNSVAYKSIVIHPKVVGDVTQAAASYASPYGLISSEWKKSVDAFTLNVEIPANTTATIYLPAGSTATITEGGKLITNRNDLKKTGTEKGSTLIRVGSGKYNFIASDRFKNLTFKK